WRRRGNATDYANALDALCSDFSRGWKGRDAVRLLSARARSPQLGLKADRPETRAAATLLLRLSQLEYETMPNDRNWLLDDGASAGGSDDPAAEEADPNASPDDAEAGATRHPVHALIAQKRKAAVALANLLDDHRLLRVSGDTGSHYGSSFGSDDSGDEVKRIYRSLPRPRELGEVALQLLAPILPDEVTSRSEEGSATASILAWLERIAPLSEEQLAWSYLSSAESSSDGGFRAGMSYLIRNGSPESQAKLQEVFLDPAVWSGYSRQAPMSFLPLYLKRFSADGGDLPAFGARLLAVVKSVLQAEQEGASDDESRKRRAAEHAGDLKILEQLIKPRGLAELLAEFTTMPLQKARPLLHPLRAAVLAGSRAEAEREILRAAVRIGDPGVKHRVLGMLYRPARRVSGAKAKPEAPLGKFPADAATREAAVALLEDSSPFQSPNN
ncbi:MAG TPA: hypothetical protein VF593_06910, partial [Chthoniobacteraceae bacterium]